MGAPVRTEHCVCACVIVCVWGDGVCASTTTLAPAHCEEWRSPAHPSPPCVKVSSHPPGPDPRVHGHLGAYYPLSHRGGPVPYPGHRADPSCSSSGEPSGSQDECGPRRRRVGVLSARDLLGPVPPPVQPCGCMDLWELIIICLTAVALSLIQVFGTRGREVQTSTSPGNRRDRGQKKG